MLENQVLFSIFADSFTFDGLYLLLPVSDLQMFFSIGRQLKIVVVLFNFRCDVHLPMGCRASVTYVWLQQSDGYKLIRYEYDMAD